MDLNSHIDVNYSDQLMNDFDMEIENLQSIKKAKLIRARKTYCFYFIIIILIIIFLILLISFL